MKPRLIPVIFLGMLLAAPCHAGDNAHKLVKQGNRHIIDSELAEALAMYLEARATRDSLRPEIQYNLGGVYSRMGDFARSDSLFNSLPPETRRELLARAAYNRGRTFAEAKQYKMALESFIDALKLDPSDLDSKINLELARRQLQQQQQQQENENKKDKRQQEDQQNRQDKQDQRPQSDQQGEQEDERDREQDESAQEDSRQEEMDREFAERFLDQLQQDEKELLKQVIRQQIPQARKKPGKSW